MPAQDSSDHIRQQVSAWLNTTPYAASLLAPLAGGQANFTYRARLTNPLNDGTTEVIVKHGEPYMARHPANAVTVDRCDVEREVLSELSTYPIDMTQSGNTAYTVRTTTLYAYDAETKTLVLEYLPNAVDLKTYSLSHFPSPTPEYLRKPAHELGKVLARYMVKFHDMTREIVQKSLKQKHTQQLLGFNRVIDSSNDMQRLKHWINFDWMIDRVSQFPGILSEAKDILHLVKNMALKELSDPSADLALIHGDYYPQNILLEDARLEPTTTRPLYVIDWENCQVGVPSLDHGGMLGEMYVLWKYKHIDAGLWTSQGYADGLGHQTEDAAWRLALQVGVHLLSFGTLASGWGTTEEVEDMARLARDVIVKAWTRDRSWFDKSDFACLFAGTVQA
ncbi:phosphotransferase enzyme family [Fusarium pseudocircinatum]|uniref:Phosphotransferase enzyme family n=1 Tax=Fusarium pseudocircinatum TaxID=56676 RepID=A0A8H5P7D7_9HYPO|nr:phosphotransferase enzyme family [Fusarium pseudocircinatum]